MAKHLIKGDMIFMKSNPDDRRDNVQKLKKNIDNTVKNMELGEELISSTNDNKKKKDIEEKNIRRQEAIKGMRDEIKDEVSSRKYDND